MLDLVITRRLGYGAIATMTRMPAEEVRGRARAAVVALAGTDPGEDVTALLLGLADEEQARRARARVADDPTVRVAAGRAVAGLRAGWDGYQPPGLPRGRPSWLPWAGAGALGAAAVVAVLAATGVLGGDDVPAGRGGPSAVEIPAPVRIALRAPGGAADVGSATIGTTASLASYLQLELARLPAPPRGTVYLLWADDGEGRGFPLPTPVEQRADGRFSRRYALSPALAPILRISRRIELLSVDARRLAGLLESVDAIGEAGGATVFPRRPGTVLLRGTI